MTALVSHIEIELIGLKKHHFSPRCMDGFLNLYRCGLVSTISILLYLSQYKISDTHFVCKAWNVFLTWYLQNITTLPKTSTIHAFIHFLFNDQRRAWSLSWAAQDTKHWSALDKNPTHPGPHACKHILWPIHWHREGEQAPPTKGAGFKAPTLSELCYLMTYYAPKIKQNC